MNEAGSSLSFQRESPASFYRFGLTSFRDLQHERFGHKPDLEELSELGGSFVLISMRLELPKTLHRLRLQRRFLSRSMVVLFKIEGNFPCLRARSAHMVGNLPVKPVSETSVWFYSVL